jgi:hypothetical protein
MKRASRIAALSLLLTATHAFAQQPAPGAVEPQTRGPIHEAFAQPVDVTADPGMPLPKEPPAPINELPPDQQPDGPNVQWLPGYWAWDADRSDFIWISGVYRNAPPGRRYVPGYWTNTPEGWRWVPGFWSADPQAVPTVPPPPESLESGPSAPPPDDNSAYVPGMWLFQSGRFAWRPGYWTAFRPGLVWVPAHYVWTPAGYIFVDGYWDLPLDNRGLLFAPVAFSGSPWLDPGWSYTPAYVVSPAAIVDACFYRPRSCHLYFGNYFGPGCATLGFRPWFTGMGRYDPALSHHVWQHRGTPNWYAGYRQTYVDRQAGKLTAPPRTFAQHAAFVQNGGRPLVTTLNQAAQQGSGVRIVRAAPAQHAAQKVLVQQSRQAAQVRQQRDTMRVVNAVPRITTAPAGNVQKYTPQSPVHIQHSAPAIHTAPALKMTPAKTFTPAPVNVHHATAVAPVLKSTTTRAVTSAHAPTVTHAAPVHRGPVTHAAPVHRATPVHHSAPARSSAKGGKSGRH